MPFTNIRQHRSWLKAWCVMLLLLIALSTGWVFINYGFFHQSNSLYARFLRFKTDRDDIIKHESAERFASDIQLGLCEEKANDIFLSLKWAEQTRWIKNETLHRMHDNMAPFDNMRKEMENSMIYNVLRDMPKGAALQVHDIGMTKIDDILTLTYTNNLWVCINSVKVVYNHNTNPNPKNNNSNNNNSNNRKGTVSNSNNHNHETRVERKIKHYIENVLNQVVSQNREQNQTENLNQTVFLRQLLNEIENLTNSGLKEIKNSVTSINNKVKTIVDNLANNTEEDELVNDVYYMRDYLLFYFSRDKPAALNTDNKSSRDLKMNEVNKESFNAYNWYNENTFDKEGDDNVPSSSNHTNEINSSNEDIDCKWVLLSDLRREYGENVINDEIKRSLTINSDDHHSQWNIKLYKIRRLLNGLIYYAPVFPKYIQCGLRNIYEDGINYIELRSELRNLYDLNEYTYDIQDTINVLKDVSDDAIIRYTSFFGTKIIYCPSRSVTNVGFEKILQRAITLKRDYKDFFLGLDFLPEVDSIMSFEEQIRLPDFIYSMWLQQNKLDYYFSNNENSMLRDIDSDNIINMYLLGSKRVTFTTKLLRHPYLLRKIYKDNTPVIITPVSNPLLQRSDAIYHSNPAIVLFNFNMALIVSSEYPSLWKTAPLTMDYYLLLMRLSDTSADLRTLKQLLYNSIVHSKISETHKLMVMAQWNILWSQWICKLQGIPF